MRYLREQEHWELRTDIKLLDLVHEAPIMKNYKFFQKETFQKWLEEKHYHLDHI